MKKFVLPALAVLFCQLLASAQTDTSYLYFNNNWKSCSKDTAFYYARVYKNGSLWERKDYWAEGNKLQMEGSYLKKDLKTEQGLFNWYDESGVLTQSKLYDKGNTIEITIYYKNGKERAKAFYANSKQTGAKGWDEKGNEIADFIFEKEAVFPGGLIGWRQYLEQTLDANVAANANAPVGVYTVKVQFIINKEGEIGDVKAISVPENCRACGLEAVRVISSAPNWQPAIQYNKRVIYQAIQHISFQVEEDKKQKS